MSASDIRDGVFDRLTRPGHPYVIARKTPVPQLQSNQLPALSVFVLGGRASSDGDENVGEPRLVWDDTIGISIARGYEDPVVLEGQIQCEVETILTTLLTDSTFVRFGGPVRKVPEETWAAGDAIYWDVARKRATKVSAGNLRMGSAGAAAANPSNAGQLLCLFEGVIGSTRRWVFPQDGETYFAELRLELTFRSRADYPPVIADDLDLIHVTTAFPNGGTAEQVARTLQVTRDYDLTQE